MAVPTSDNYQVKAAGKDIYIYIYIHKWFSNIKLNKSAQWVERLYLCRKRVNEYSNN